MNNRVITLSELLADLINGEKPAEVKAALAEQLKLIDPKELAEAEDLLIDQGYDIGSIQRANDLHTDLVSANLSDEMIPEDLAKIPGHPACVFRGENLGISNFFQKVLEPDLGRFLQSRAEKDRINLLADANEAADMIRHFERKENLFFPYLEKAGITAPPQVMWGVDDIIRDLLRLLADTIKQEPVNIKRLEMVYERLSTQVLSMIKKENEILLPMLTRYMTESDWILAAKESVYIGYVFNKGIEGASNSDAAVWLAQAEANKPQAEKADKDLSASDKIKLPSGNFTIDQLTAMLNTLPTDLTFIDSDDVVQYYTEGKHQVFARTRTIIGRDIYLCHPPHLVPTIRKLLQAFKSGEKDSVVVPVRKGGRLNLVRYYAVRDEQGQYIGTVEVTEEISEILEITAGK